jgi:hypothetical protein
VLSNFPILLHSPDDSDAALLLRQFTLGPVDVPDTEPTAVHYSNFFSPIAFPISVRQPGVSRILADISDPFFPVVPRVACFIAPELCPLKSSLLWAEYSFETKPIKGPSKTVLVSLTHSAAVRANGTLIDCQPELTQTGLRLNEKYTFDADPQTSALLVTSISLGIAPLTTLLPLLSDAGTLTAALTAPNLILPLVLLNSASFPLSLAKHLFSVFVSQKRHHFLVRALFLAEISQTSQSLLFAQHTRYSRPLLVLFCAWGIDWAVGLLEQCRTLEPMRLLKAVLNACGALPALSFYMLRALLILGLLTLGDVREVFALFLRFIARVFKQVMRAKEIQRPVIACIISQLLIGVENRGGAATEAVRAFEKFLERTIRKMPEVAGDEGNIEELTTFISAKDVEIRARVREFMDQAADQQILIFSFAQNFRFLGRERAESQTV